MRYRLLETVRRYAAEQLAAAGESRAVQERHAAWCLALAEAAWPHRTGREQGIWLERLAVEHDNLRAALGWSLADARNAQAGLRLAGLLWYFWRLRGHLAEGRRWLHALLERGGQAPPDVRARALDGAGALAFDQADLDEAARLLEQGLELRRELGNELSIAGTLILLGAANGERGDTGRARTLFEESLALARRHDDPARIGTSLMDLGIVARQEGDLERAVSLHERALDVFRGMGDTHGMARALLNLANALRDQGAHDRAATRYRESLSLYPQMRDQQGVARCLLGLAEVATACGGAERAARLCGAVIALREAIGAPVPAAARANVERITATARTALGDEAFAAAWAAGHALSLDQAVAEGLRGAAHETDVWGPADERR